MNHESIPLSQTKERYNIKKKSLCQKVAKSKMR